MLVLLYELMRRYQSGSWNFNSGTIWSRLTYRLAKERNQLAPSPIVDRFNMTRSFEKQVNQAASTLVRQKYCRWKNIRTDQTPSTQVSGYKKHRSRGRDLFLTPKGVDEVIQILRSLGRWAEDEMSRCDENLVSTGPVASGQSGCGD